MSANLPVRRSILGWLSLVLPAPVAAAAPALAPARLGPLLHVSRIADLRRIDVTQLTQNAPAMCDVAGYWEPGDGGGGVFDWDPAASAAADGFMVFLPETLPAGARGRWRRRLPHDGSVNFEMAGARADGVTDDSTPCFRVAQHLIAAGGGLIRLLPGHRYFLRYGLDLASADMSPIVVDGDSGPLGHAESSRISFHAPRILLPPTASITLGTGCVLRRLVVWRQGLEEKPSSMEDLRRNVNQWFAEDGSKGRRSVAVYAPFGDLVIEQVVIVGFHTGIVLEGGGNRVDRCYIDTAGYGIECTNIAGVCELNEVNTGAVWSINIPGRDAYGDHAYRPGTAFYIHDHTDGMQINSCQSGHWVYGMILRNVWMVSVFQFTAETTENNGQPTYGIWTQGEVRHVNIIDPRVITSSTCVRFSHATRTSAVNLIGGSLEMDGASGHCVQIDGGTSGQIFGTMTSNGKGSALSIAAGIIQWKIFSLQLWTSCYKPWAEIHPASLPNVYLVGTRALDNANQQYMQSHINERTLISCDSSMVTLDGSSSAPLTVESLAPASALTGIIALRRNGADVGSLRVTAKGVSLSAAQLAFFGSSPVERPVVSGSRSSPEAMHSLVTALAKLGLVTDQTTP